MIPGKTMMENIQESPTAVIVTSILSLLIVFGLYVLKKSPITQNIRDKLYEYKQKIILSLVVKNGEIRNTNSWSFSNMALYLLESFDML
jgi:hypothetical protein